MTKTAASAPGKVILFGEHAVVYGRPAIAAPLSQVRTRATVTERDGQGILLAAPDINKRYLLSEASEGDPFARAVRLVLDMLSRPVEPALTVKVQSDLPIASGLGSGAAMAAAVIRALHKHMSPGAELTDEQVSNLTYQVETILHGTPSGIDNSVVSAEKPIYFIRQERRNLIELLEPGESITLLVADTGVISRTKVVVGDVRRRWKKKTAEFERFFDECGQIAQSARRAIEKGDIDKLGWLMTENQAVLRRMTVSSVELERLIAAAEEAGATGAKLSGAGRGGNIIALVGEENAPLVHQALIDAGAAGVLESVIS